MSSQAHIRAELDQLFELNCLFLSYLKRLAGDGVTHPRLPGAAAAVLCGADTNALERAAQFPQALFRLRLRSRVADDPVTPRGASHVDARRSLQLTILLCAWNQCRQSVYAARLYLGLGNAQIRTLRTTSLSELTELAVAADLLGCVHSESEWFWTQLLTATSAERRRQLSLLGLQPKLSEDWRVDFSRPRLSSM
jgi:hypothetical protein